MFESLAGMYRAAKVHFDQMKYPFIKKRDRVVAEEIYKNEINKVELTEKYEKLTVIHLDAHRDLAFEFIGEKYSHATVMRRVHELGVDLVQVGIRSSSWEEEEFVKSTYNIQTFKNKDVHRHMDAVEYYLATVETPIYLSVDMDVFDPAIAPAVGNPAPGGLFTSEVEDVIKALAFKEVVGLDVVETATDKLGENTAVTAAKVIYDFLSLI